MLVDPTMELEFPQEERRLPSGMLSADETDRVLAIPDVTTSTGLRDRAILETLFSTAIRRRELANLHVHDVHPERGIVTIHRGKGRKDRVVPIGARALAWIDRYLQDSRPKLLKGTGENTLFLSYRGRPLIPTFLSNPVRRYFDQAEIKQPGSCHLFRHTAASQMLERGADIRVLQEFLGHERLDTTQIYTHVSITQLKAVHERTHPAEQPRS